MNVLEIIILGIIQGITEFLPISSSGHLAIFHYIFGQTEMLFYDVLLHFATLLAVVVLFFKDIIDFLKKPKILLYIILLSIPTGIIGLFIKKYLSFVYEYNNMLLVGIFLAVTGYILFLADKIKQSDLNLKSISEIKLSDVLLIGIAQGISALPGISRSGATLSVALMLKMKREDAVKFIFISAIPAILAATLLEIKEALGNPYMFFDFKFLYGVVSAFVFGLFSLKFLINILSRQRLRYFSYYCWGVSLLTVVLYFIKR